MRICLVGEFSGDLDEGMRGLTSNLGKELSKRHETLLLDLKGYFSTRFWRDLKEFQPQIIHYVPGPSIMSFIITKTIKARCRQAKTVMSATHTAFLGLRGFSYGPSYILSSLLMYLIPLLKPDLMLTQSHETERFFVKMGCRTKFFPSGVDTERFVPAINADKEKLRKKYGIDAGKFVLLHVGSVKKRRNVQILKRLQGNGNQILIIGSPSTGVEKAIQQDLIASNCLVWAQYFTNIEEVYALSDCYVFPPVKRVSSIELPLSVLEAMSCNLPVVTTKFGALPRIFQDGSGLFYADKEEDFAIAVDKVKDSGFVAKTRDMVLPYSWEKISLALESIYEQM